MKIFLIGFMGCGKTHWGKLLSEKLNVPFFDLDDKIVEHKGKSIPDIFATDGEEQFRVVERDVLHLVSENHESFVMATGGGTPCFFNNIDYLKRQGTVVWINCSTDCLYHRLVDEKNKRPLIANIADNELKGYIIKNIPAAKSFISRLRLSCPRK